MKLGNLLLLAVFAIGLAGCGIPGGHSSKDSSLPIVAAAPLVLPVQPVEDYGHGLLVFYGFPLHMGMENLSRYLDQHQELSLVSVSVEDQFGRIYAVVRGKDVCACGDASP